MMPSPPDITLGTGAYMHCEGKGRPQRAVPLTGPVESVLRSWLAERRGLRDEPAFPTRTGRRLSRDTVQRHVSAYAAATRCPPLKTKKLSPPYSGTPAPWPYCTRESTPR